MTDFEKAAISAFEEEFPMVVVTGCFYHLSQSVYRRIQSEGLVTDYITDEALGKYLRMLPALALLPTDTVVPAFEEAFDEDYPLYDRRAQSVIDYFEDTYIGRSRRRGRDSPLFPIGLWNVHERSLRGAARTNNAIEGWHNAFQSHMGSNSPNIWRFITILRREVGLVHDQVRALARGLPLPKRRRVYRDVQVRVENILAQLQYGQRVPVEALEGLASNFMF